MSGLVVGALYFLGLLLQGIETIHTFPSVSVFITSLDIVYVHIYSVYQEKM